MSISRRYVKEGREKTDIMVFIHEDDFVTLCEWAVCHLPLTLTLKYETFNHIGVSFRGGLGYARHLTDILNENRISRGLSPYVISKTYKNDELVLIEIS